MSKNLVIVESPAKAKTIEGFLGKDFTVKSSFGHVRDLVKKGMGINVDKNFEPEYEISPDKEKVITELKKLAKNAETVWLATDEDREGEAISWHLAEALNLKISDTKRIVFHEITKPAILKAIQNPRKIDKHLVDAQQARRILDRLVGFELSPVLWKKVRPSLSAGRVQSVAVRLIVEREREIQAFKPTSAYRVVAEFMAGGALLKAELNKRFATREDAKAFLEKCKGAKFSIGNLETKPAKRSPAAPFTTSTLQQEAARKLSFSVAQTMMLAQRLYEAGKITYMRTDSVNLSETALGQAKAAINSFYGAKYHHPRQYKTKAKGAQEAHEAIRPTYIENQHVEGERNEQRLYELIWKRTIASQMADAELEKTTATITISTATENFVAQGEVLKFDGFLKVYLEGSDEDEESNEDSGMLPPLKVGDTLTNKNITATEKYTHHPPRYTEASLVKKLEELGIGRPSTYAPTISTVQKRNYVEKTDRMGTPREYHVLALNGNNIEEKLNTENTGAEKAKLFPTDIGMVVTDFLMQYFADILDFHFTAHVEEEFDEIAEGKLDWTKMLKDFYKPFHKNIESTIDKSERASGERNLGIDPASGKPVIVRIGRFGPLAQIGDSSDENEKPRFAGLRKDQRMETITLEEALLLFRMPRVVGEFEGKEMKVGIGRFGPYVVHNNVFTSLGKEDDPYEVSGDRCVELILAKRKKDAEKLIKTFDENPDLKVLNGRWGPFIALGKKFFKIPKNTEAARLDFAGVVQLIGGMDAYEAAVASNSRIAASKKPAPKKAGKTAKEPKTAAKAAKKVKTSAKPAKKTAVKKARKAVKKK
jgi:DNA topoisomerase-1